MSLANSSSQEAVTSQLRDAIASSIEDLSIFQTPAVPPSPSRSNPTRSFSQTRTLPVSPQTPSAISPIVASSPINLLIRHDFIHTEEELEDDESDFSTDSETFHVKTPSLRSSNRSSVSLPDRNLLDRCNGDRYSLEFYWRIVL